MPASNQIIPKGGYNNIGFDYWTPQTAAQTCIFYTSTAATTAFFKLNVSGAAIEVDTINELTSAAGVTLDSVRLKDGGVRQSNNTFLLGRNAANSADVNLFKLNASDVFEFAPASFLVSTNLTISPNTSDGSDNQYIQVGHVDTTRGAFAIAYGNENAATGLLKLTAGNVSGGKVEILAQHSTGTIDSYTAGSLSSQVTSAGDLALNRAGASIRFASIAAGLTAGGADQAGATAVVSTIAYISTGTGGVRLPDPVSGGRVQFLYNFSGNTINIYPHTGGSINSGATNAPLTLATSTAMFLWNFSTTAWIAIRGN